jgi:hypothetical protein
MWKGIVFWNVSTRLQDRERSGRMLMELVGSQKWRYVVEVLDLYVQNGQGPHVSESFMLSGLRH